MNASLGRPPYFALSSKVPSVKSTPELAWYSATVLNVTPLAIPYFSISLKQSVGVSSCDSVPSI